MSFGPPAGSVFAGPSGGASGLPFAGIPAELRDQAQRVLDREPEHRVEPVTFSQVHEPSATFSLRTVLGGQTRGVALAAVLVVAETLLAQAGPVLSKVAIDDGIVPRDMATLWRVAALYLAVIVVSSITGSGRIAWTTRLGERLMEQLRVRVFSHLQRLSVDYFTDEKAGVVMTRMTSDIDNLSMLFQEGIVQIAVQGLAVVAISTALVVLQPLLAAFTIVLVVPPLVGLTLWFRSASNRGFDAVRDRIAALISDLAESLGGIRLITALNRRRHNLVHHVNLAGEHLDANLYTARVGAIYGPGTEMVGIVAQALVLAYGGHLVLEDQLTVGGLVAFLLFVNLFFTPIQQLVQQYNTYQQGQASIRKLRDLLTTRPTVVERAGAPELAEIEGEITFDHVGFEYLAGRPVLSDINLRIAAGETVALVGPTGAGKSTLAKLVIRFADPTSGRVLIDGIDLRDVTLTSLRRQLGVVPQEPFLFSGTIRDNLAFADPTIGDDILLDAARQVGLGDLISRLPDGLDAPCHERGGSFSSGERQLLALARAFLARPRVLVLDEATSSLDLRSEQQIESALDVVLSGRTAIVIAHRLATAMRADRIGVVDDGRIVELGTPNELIELGGRFAAMYATWLAHTVGAPTS